MPTPMPMPTDSVDYALAASVRARLLGALLGVLGVLVCVMTVVVFVARLPLDVLSAVVLLVLLVVVLAGYALTRRSYVVRAGPSGYQVRFVRGVGVSAAPWTDVVDVVTVDVAGSRCVELRLRDGRTSTIPVDVLATDPEQFVRELRTHLERRYR